jgi:hypothetical protein
MFWPVAGVVIDAQDLQSVVVYPVGDDEWRFGDDQFACARAPNAPNRRAAL